MSEEQIEYAEEGVQEAETFALSLDGVILLKQLLVFTASKGGFELQMYNKVADLNVQLDEFLSPYVQEALRQEEENKKELEKASKKKSK